jgi:hypothetical protein
MPVRKRAVPAYCALAVAMSLTRVGTSVAAGHHGPDPQPTPPSGQPASTPAPGNPSPADLKHAADQQKKAAEDQQKAAEQAQKALEQQQKQAADQARKAAEEAQKAADRAQKALAEQQKHAAKHGPKDVPDPAPPAAPSAPAPAVQSSDASSAPAAAPTIAIATPLPKTHRRPVSKAASDNFAPVTVHSPAPRPSAASPQGIHLALSHSQPEQSAIPAVHSLVIQSRHQTATPLSGRRRGFSSTLQAPQRWTPATALRAALPSIRLAEASSSTPSSGDGGGVSPAVLILLTLAAASLVGIGREFRDVLRT